jgi:hypothetical protein
MILSLLSLKWLTPRRCRMPAAPSELLATVNTLDVSSSAASGNTEDSRGPHIGDLYTGCFGDVITNKSSNTLRIGFQNVGGFPINKGKIKEDNTRMGLTKWEFDIFGCAETNLDWRILPE